MKSLVRIGTRGSTLAMYQAEVVKIKIANDFPLVQAEIVKIKTGGDMIRRGGMSPLVTKRIYTREIEDSLLKGEVDIAVHSAKDLATELPGGLIIGAVLEREDPRDCLIASEKKTLAQMPHGARIGTSSLRRKMQLIRLNSGISVEELHGNVETRLKKVDEGHYDAIVLAHAGLKRLGLSQHASEIFSEDIFYPAPGQGIIAAQCREGDPDVMEFLKPLHHEASGRRLECERAYLHRLEGGCQLPCGITTFIQGNQLSAAGGLFGVEPGEWVEDKKEGPAEYPRELGIALAEIILAKGGREILESIRRKLFKES